MKIELSKYHGLGNDYLVYDCNKNSFELTSSQIKLICDRNFGLGSDGILIGPFMEKDTFYVKIMNPDGSEAEKSGNGVRIFAKYLMDTNYVKDSDFILKTLGGDVRVKYLNDKGTLIKVSMGKLSFDSEEIGVIGNKREVVNEKFIFNNQSYNCTCVSIGNPHCVILLEDISKELACNIGTYAEKANYFPNRINTQLVKVIDRNNILIEIFERGAGYTLASGSSSCAAAGAVYKLGLVDNLINVHMPGGDIKIQMDNEWNVDMTGAVSSIGKMELSEEFLVQYKFI